MAANFCIRVIADPQALPRVINFFAQRSLVLARLHCDTQGDEQTIHLAASNLDSASAVAIAEKMRSAVLILSVELALAEA